MDTLITDPRPASELVLDVALHRARGTNDAGHVVGERHHRAVHSDHDCYLMRELRDEGMGLKEIAIKFETSKGTVHDIVTGRRRGHIVTRTKFA